MVAIQCQDCSDHHLVESVLAETVVTTTRQQTKEQVGNPYVSDVWEPYVSTIKTTYRERESSEIWPGWDIVRPTEGIRLTQAIKHRKGRRLVRVGVRAAVGDPVDQPYAVHLEHLNGTLRDRLNCLAWKTYGFAKEVDTWDALFRLTLFEHNWLRSHIALRVPLPEPQDDRRYHQRSPAMALHLTDYLWSWQEFLLFRIR